MTATLAAPTAKLAVDHQNVVAAFGWIIGRLATIVQGYDVSPTENHWFGPQKTYQPNPEFKSIMDELQDEYRSGRITEAERDAIRAHLKLWLGDPAKHRDAVKWTGIQSGYDAYSCGLWAPTAAPWGEYEHQFLLMALEIIALEYEAEHLGRVLE
jgi:hypothetical protein